MAGQPAALTDDRELLAIVNDLVHAPAGFDVHADRTRLCQEGVEDHARGVGIRKQLSARFLVKRDTRVGEEADGVVYRPRVEDPRDRGSRSAPEVRSRHRTVRHVAASAAADQDLRSEALGAVDDSDARTTAGGHDGRREARGAAPDDNALGRSGLGRNQRFPCRISSAR